MMSSLASAPGAPATDALLERVRVQLAASGQPPTPSRVAAALRSLGAVLGDAHILEITAVLQSEISGAGPLDALIRLPGVSDVLVNGPEEVWIDRGHGLEPTDVRFPDDAAIRALAQRLAATAGRRLDDAAPFVDARLPGGVRLHAVVPPVAPDGALISLRVPPRRHFTLDDLMRTGTVPLDLAPIVRAIVKHRLAFLVTGGTGSGKTTVLNTLLSLADDTERIVIVEDSTELNPRHRHVVRLEGRVDNVENTGRVDLTTLVRQALRMRPDRIVVGEVRGSEVVDLLRSMNTGHEGGCGTLHANSAPDVPARLEALGISAGLSRAAVHAQAASALHAIIHLRRSPGGKRRLEHIQVVQPAAGFLGTERAIAVAADGSVSRGPGYERLVEMLREHGWEPC